MYSYKINVTTEKFETIVITCDTDNHGEKSTKQISLSVAEAQALRMALISAESALVRASGIAFKESK